jgi:hypothetical protein
MKRVLMVGGAGALWFALGVAGVTAAPRGGKVSVTEKEWTIKPSGSSVSAGKVTFDAKNTGQEDHELVVLRTNTPAAKLPIAVVGAVPEVAPLFVDKHLQGHIAALKPGQTRHSC